MRRWRLGAGLLALLLAAGLVSGAWMERFHGELETLAHSGWEAVREGDTEQAARVLQLLQSRWEGAKALTSVLAEHAALEEVDALLMQLTVSRDRQFLEENSLQLASLLGALAKSQRLTMENLL